MFTNPTSFFQTGLVVSTETFDEIPSGTIIGLGSATLDGITYTSADPSAQWNVTSSLGGTPSLPNALIQNNAIVPATLTFAGGNESAVLGFNLFTPRLEASLYRIDVGAANGETLSEVAEISNSGIYRGFESQYGITYVIVTPLYSNGFTNFAFDNVSRGVITGVITTVPEPSSLTLGTAGTLVLLASTWWQRLRGRDRRPLFRPLSPRPAPPP